MRNLKKLLALVLAMVMAFSLMLTASATSTAGDFSDIDQVDDAFVEAVDVLTGMKVYQGDEKGFRPGDTITRAEVAALIYRLATGDVNDDRAGLYANYGNFTDVNESDWFAGYVGYCANAGYIKGTTPTTFNPYGAVTGYETLAMILRAIGYDKNGEFTGATWQTNVSALATQLRILDNIKTTHYANTLHLASRRDVVAELLFQADAYVPMVIYTPAFGYQPYGMVNGGSGDLIGSTQSPNPTLGRRIFGLTYSSTSTDKNGDGKGIPVLLGNQQTGETKSVMGYKGTATKAVTGGVLPNSLTSAPFTEYTWEGNYDLSSATLVNGVLTGIAAASGTASQDAVLGKNEKYTLETGIDLIGHKLKLWYDDGNGAASKSGQPVYAYFDKSTLNDVVAITDGINNTGARVPVDNPTAVDETATQGAGTIVVDGKNLYDVAGEAGFVVNSRTTVAFNNSFGKFGSAFATGSAGAVGSGERVDAMDDVTSPVRMYKLISNSSDKSLDVVIALNIESSQITETNTVNRVPTLGVPVNQPDTNPLVGVENAAATDWNGTTAVMEDIQVEAQLQTMFIDGDLTAVTSATNSDKNLKNVNGTVTGVIAQDALVGNSTKALGDYEFGIHITGTSPRTVSKAEHDAINLKGQETSYFLMNQVTAPVQGTVVAYNVNAGTVTLDNGTVLQRSKFYHTVVGWDDEVPVATDPAPSTAIPQGWVKGATYWEEGYANVSYKFYLDYEGKYLGAERASGSTFLYGTYLDYDQKTSSSTFNYYLTGVDMNGEIQTVQLKKFWDGQDVANQKQPASIQPDGGVGDTYASLKLLDITGTDELAVPFRDTYGVTTGVTNGIGEGVYMGFAITGDIADSIAGDPYTDRGEYVNNMNRLGIHNGAVKGDSNYTAEDAFNEDIVIGNTDATLGAKQTSTTANAGAGSGKYFTEATKFILVSGYGTDSVKAKVYNGISELKGTASSVVLDMNGTVAPTGDVKIAHIKDDTAINAMTYYTESPYTYAQSGQTAMKIDTIILPEAAVSWSGGSGLYYVGDPSYTSINSWGTDAWKYNLYQDGELKQVWLTNDPSKTTGGPTTEGVANGVDDYNLVPDVFLNLKDTGKTANDGQPIYTAGRYNLNGVWTAGMYFYNDNNASVGAEVGGPGAGTTTAYDTGATNYPNLGYMQSVEYSAITRDAQTATFGGANGVIGTGSDDILLRVAGAKVVNLNAQANCIKRPASGYIWPGISDLATLNQAGSINPVTGRPLKVSAVVDPNNPLIVTTIYVCYEQ